MSLLIFVLLVLVILSLAIYATQLLPFPDARLKSIFMFLLVVIAIVLIVQRSGLGH